MTARDDFDRLLSAWFQGDAPTSEPEQLLGQVLARTARTPRRRAWPVLERLSNMQATMRLPVASRGLVVLPVLLLLTVVAIALIAIGSERRIPPPFGLAKPGLIAYESDGDILLARTDGTTQATLAAGPEFGFAPTWSRDGTRLAYWSAAGWDKPATLVVVDPDGSHALELATGIVAPSTRLSWSPDGRRIAFSAQVGVAYRLMIAELGESQAGQVGDDTVRGTDPVWAPDGRTLAFTGGSTYRDVGVYVVNDDGSGYRRLTDVPDTLELGDYDWSSDGGWLVFTAGSFAHHDIWVVSSDGLVERKVAATEANEYAPVWSPDGKRIAYVSDSWNGPAKLAEDTTIVVDADGSHPTVVGHNIGIGLWSPDGAYVVGWVPDEKGNYGPRLFDPTGNPGPRLLRADPISWQRLAP